MNNVLSLEDLGGYWGEVDTNGKEVLPTQHHIVQPAPTIIIQPPSEHHTFSGAGVALLSKPKKNILEAAKERLDDVKARLDELRALEAEAAMLERMIAAAEST